jgi:hypothetical protein
LDARDCLPQIATTDSVTIVNGVFAAAPAIARSVVVAAEVAAVAGQSAIDLTAAGAQENYRLHKISNSCNASSKTSFDSQQLDQLPEQEQLNQPQRPQN